MTNHKGHARPDVSPGRQTEIPLISGRGPDIETLLHRIGNANVQATKYGRSILVGPFDHLEFGKISSTNVGELQARIRCLEAMGLKGLCYKARIRPLTGSIRDTIILPCSQVRHSLCSPQLP